MNSPGSITVLIRRAELGDDDALSALLSHFSDRLGAIAKQYLGGTTAALGDEEDVVLSAFNAFWNRTRNVQNGSSDNRDDFFRLIMRITINKALDRLKSEKRLKRGGGKVRCETAIKGQNGEVPFSVEQKPDRQVNHEAMLHAFEELLECLDDQKSRTAVILRLNGLNDVEIAEAMLVSHRTVSRYLSIAQRKLETRFLKQEGQSNE